MVSIGEQALSKVTAEDFRSFPLFRDMSPGAIAALAAACTLRDHGPGEPVITHNDTTFDVFFLVSGRLSVSLYAADGQHVGFHEMGAGGMFGEISAVDGLPRSVSVETVSSCRIAMLPRARFLAMIETSPCFAMAVARQLAAQVRRLTTRVFEFSTMAVRQRLRAELLRQARPAEGDSAVIEQLPTHAELASRISTHREAVSREMAWLDGQGLVAKQGRSLVIPSVPRIQALIEDSWAG